MGGSEFGLCAACVCTCRLISDLARDIAGVAVRLSECHGLADDRDCGDDGDDDDDNSSCCRNTNAGCLELLGLTSYSLLEIWRRMSGNPSLHFNGSTMRQSAFCPEKGSSQFLRYGSTFNQTTVSEMSVSLQSLPPLDHPCATPLSRQWPCIIMGVFPRLLTTGAWVQSWCCSGEICST